MPKKANAAACINLITLDAIKEIICPYEVKHTFICDVLDPLTTEGYQSIADDCSVIRSHLSEFMKGNINQQGKRQSVSTLKLWAKKISNKRIYSQLLQRLDPYVDLNEIQLHQISDLIALDKSDMPSKLVYFLEQTIESHLYVEMILMLMFWSVYGKDQIHLLNSIYSAGPLSVQNVRQEEPVLLQHIIPPKPIFLGRDSILEKIHHVLNQENSNGFVFLQGMGGIGKSECAKQYAKKYHNQYDSIVFAEYNGSLVNLINNNHIFSLTKPFISEKIPYADNTIETDLEFYYRKLTQLRCSVNQRTLIILDNMDANDPQLPDFLTGICHVIITTRWHSSSFYPNETIFVEDIADNNICREIFTRYYGKSIEYDPYVDKILGHFSGHPMALELVASQMKVSNLSAHKMFDILQEHKENSLEEGFSTLLTKHEMNMATHIRQLFVIADLTDEELYILKCLALLPKKGLQKNLVKKFCGLKNYSVINHLIQHSWIRDLDGIISLHTLIQEVIQITCKPQLKDCIAFIRGLMHEFSSVHFYYERIQQKDYIFEYVSHIYKTFPEPSEEFYEVYEWIELILSHYGSNEQAIQLGNKLYSLYNGCFGTSDFRTARMLCRIGCNVKNDTDDFKSKHLLETGRQILKSQKSASDSERLYISDVDMVLIDTYITLFYRFQNPEDLDNAQKLCEELIKIRSSVQKQFDISMVNCLVAYCNLTRISILRKDYDTAEAYLEKAVHEFEKTNLHSLKFYIDCVKSELAIAQNNTEEAIASLNEALLVREQYFQAPQSDYSLFNILKLRGKLAELYEQNGNLTLAVQHYYAFIQAAQNIPYYQNICSDLSQRLLQISKSCPLTEQ